MKRLKCLKFQSTHPCGVRHCNRCGVTGIGVSIHAPVWGATNRLVKKTLGTNVSIHAPVWGATVVKKRTGQDEHCFNPRTRVGCDFTLPICWQLNGMFQSTHPCGVRHVLASLTDMTRQFQSTHPCGVRLCIYNLFKPPIRFQSTHPCGVRHLPHGNL